MGRRHPDTEPAADHQQDDYLPLVLRTFIWGFPHQYQAPAPAGTTIALDITGIGAWTLTRTATGWTLDECRAAAPTASLQPRLGRQWTAIGGKRAKNPGAARGPAFARPIPAP